MSIAEDTHTVEVILAVNLKLPLFWPSDQHLWFIQVEVQYSIRGITAQKMKYKYIVTSLPLQFTTQVRDLILHVPTASAYDTLKQKLITHTTLPVEC